MLGYDLYSSALADILTEPSLAMPIMVGLYAKWGSGKSFLLGKLREEMKSFTRDWVIDTKLTNSFLLFVVVLHLASIAGVVAWLVSYSSSTIDNDDIVDHIVRGQSDESRAIIIGISTASIIFMVSYLGLLGLWQGSNKFNWSFLYETNLVLAERFDSLKLLLEVVFSHPPGHEWIRNDSKWQGTQPLRLLFTDQTKVITSAGGQNSVTQMIGSLYDSIENQYGMFASRLYRAFRPKPVKSTAPVRWRRLCGIPYVAIYMFCFVCVLLSVILTAVSITHHQNNMKQRLQVTTKLN